MVPSVDWFLFSFARTEAVYPEPDLEWIEARFWIWVHYGAAKIARGEIFETLNFLGFLRYRVLGPLALASAGARPDGVRRIETRIPAAAERLAACVAGPDAAACLDALDATVALYELLLYGNEGFSVVDGELTAPPDDERRIRRSLA